MKKSLLIVCLFAVMALQARTWTPSQVKDIIRKVNTYWQTNNKPEVRSFWDNAAYHTGNMEVYKLFEERETRRSAMPLCSAKNEERGNLKAEREQMLDYSIRWAEHNRWMGATEPDI